jgi:hypothetical protein
VLTHMSASLLPVFLHLRLGGEITRNVLRLSA